MMEFFKGTVTRKDWTAVAIILGSTMLAAAVFVFLVHAEQKKKLASLESELTAKEGELTQALNTQRNIESLRAETKSVKELVSSFENRLPDTSDMPKLLEQFEQMAQEVGLDVTLTSQDRVVDERKETIPYSVAARGNFHQIVSFINRLERHDRYLSVSKLEITEQDEGISEAKFTLSTYSFRQPGQTPAATAAAAPVATAGGAAK
ncbi:MAG: type 4a pilus biogenesis protein PilO [FCB group bacterium]|jgi:Tfp pilus assembly protein PilO|nr:type 4a pilus biogenesis protein PilO [FCB group bacterium]